MRYINLRFTYLFTYLLCRVLAVSRDSILSCISLQVFQRRKDGHEDFYRTWNDYKTGFGQLDSEFWLGEDHTFNLSVT